MTAPTAVAPSLTSTQTPSPLPTPSFKTLRPQKYKSRTRSLKTIYLKPPGVLSTTSPTATSTPPVPPSPDTHRPPSFDHGYYSSPSTVVTFAPFPSHSAHLSTTHSRGSIIRHLELEILTFNFSSDIHNCPFRSPSEDPSRCLVSSRKPLVSPRPRSSNVSSPPPSTHRPPSRRLQRPLRPAASSSRARTRKRSPHRRLLARRPRL